MREAGQSLEFFDVRPYGAGDELRYVDWKAYARTGKLMTRLYQAERTSALQVLIDTSPSMTVGGKLGAAQRLAAMLVTTSLGMRTQVGRFGGATSPRGGTRTQLPELWRFIAETHKKNPDANVAVPASDAPAAALSAFAARSAYAAGMVVVLSDLFDEASLTPALTALRARRRLDVCFVQLLSAFDLEPTGRQALTFVHFSRLKTAKRGRRSRSARASCRGTGKRCSVFSPGRARRWCKPGFVTVWCGLTRSR